MLSKACREQRVSEGDKFAVTAHSWFRAMCLSFSALLFALGMLHQITALAKHIGLMQDGGRPGVEATLVRNGGWARATAVDPGGAAERAGLRVGDLFSVRPFESQLIHQAGARVPLKVVRGHRSFDTTLVVPPGDSGSSGHLVALASRQADLLLGLIAAAGILTMALGAFLLVRGRKHRAAVILAIILIALGGQNPLDPTWGPSVESARTLFILRLPALWLETYLWPVLCMELAGASMSRSRRFKIHGAALILALVQALASLSNWGLPGTTWFPGVPLIFLSVLLAQLLGLGVIFVNFASNDVSTRNRLKIVVFAFVCYSASLLVEIAAVPVAMAGASQYMSFILIAFVLLTAVAAVLLTYAILKQRLFDFGFAVNRTLVYGAVSFSLLAAFGLAEWGADRLVPEEWHKQSALYSAGIALLLFLSFHRLRDWFERHVERLFFAGWQRAEAALKRFVASAGHFRRAPALCREFTAEVERFAQGARAALYLRDDDGGFVRQCGSLEAEARYAQEERAFALLAAERAPVDLAEAHSALPAAMAFPMLDQLGLAGFLLVGARPDGAHYRPDEIANLAWATQQVGLDLQALQARELREEVAALRSQLARRGRRAKLVAVGQAVPAG
jgi:hypothetical protein